MGKDIRFAVRQCQRYGAIALSACRPMRLPHRSTEGNNNTENGQLKD